MEHCRNSTGLIFSSFCYILWYIFGNIADFRCLFCPIIHVPHSITILSTASHRKISACNCRIIVYFGFFIDAIFSFQPTILRII